MVCKASTGYLPEAVSPESMTTGGAVEHGVGHVGDLRRVGRGLRIMESSIWVAVMTGLPSRMVALIIFSGGWAPHGRGSPPPDRPRATITRRPPR